MMAMGNNSYNDDNIDDLMMMSTMAMMMITKMMPKILTCEVSL